MLDGIPAWLLRDFAPLVAPPLWPFSTVQSEKDLLRAFGARRTWSPSRRKLHLVASTPLCAQYHWLRWSAKYESILCVSGSDRPWKTVSTLDSFEPSEADPLPMCPGGANTLYPCSAGQTWTSCPHRPAGLFQSMRYGESPHSAAEIQGGRYPRLSDQMVRRFSAGTSTAH